MPEPIIAIDLSQVNGYQKRISAGLLSMFLNGKRVLMTFQLRYIILANITRPEKPNILRVFDFCSDPTLKYMTISVPDSFEKTTFAKFCAQNNNIAGSHEILRPDDENRFVVINYFLKFGLAQFSGLLKRYQTCLDQIIFPKKRQAAEANEAAHSLLKDIDVEKSPEEGCGVDEGKPSHPHPRPFNSASNHILDIILKRSTADTVTLEY
ncbi:unnamed protein product [Rotaria sordida]|uniref:Uncharacterized protein n=1 Tax=Rotaria sordida TaxID=392033 RepID=A0A815QS47_9BILA|nr:unnamed protein product [Rotaria sordida]CAF1467056.1 unnamed protein product [Rotaria sordida]